MSKKQKQRVRKWKRPDGPGGTLGRNYPEPQCTQCWKEHGALAKPVPVIADGLCRAHWRERHQAKAQRP